MEHEERTIPLNDLVFFGLADFRVLCRCRRRLRSYCSGVHRSGRVTAADRVSKRPVCSRLFLQNMKLTGWFGSSW